MRIAYVLLSPTFGMHQYTAHLANRAVHHHEVHLVTTAAAFRDRYSPAVELHTPVGFTNTGLSVESLQLRQLQRAIDLLRALRPDVVHLTGPHLLNIGIVRWCRSAAIPVIHTLHDLDPHQGTRLGNLLGLWNRAIIRYADHLLVHGKEFRDRLVGQALPEDKVTCTPLLHLFLSYQQQEKLANDPVKVRYRPHALFFGRVHKYKDVDTLLSAFKRLSSASLEVDPGSLRLVVAGKGQLPTRWRGKLPAGVEHRNRLIGDDEAIELFRDCGLLVLPYKDATQSALVSAAYYFRKPVIVSSAGALAEYVDEGQTGLVVPSKSPADLAVALHEMLTDSQRLMKMGAAGRRWYDARIEEEADILATLYDNIRTSSSFSIGSQSAASSKSGLVVESEFRDA